MNGSFKKSKVKKYQNIFMICKTVKLNQNNVQVWTLTKWIYFWIMHKYKRKLEKKDFISQYEKICKI